MLQIFKKAPLEIAIIIILSLMITGVFVSDIANSKGLSQLLFLKNIEVEKNNQYTKVEMKFRVETNGSGIKLSKEDFVLNKAFDKEKVSEDYNVRYYNPKKIETDFLWQQELKTGNYNITLVFPKVEGKKLVFGYRCRWHNSDKENTYYTVNINRNFEDVQLVHTGMIIGLKRLETRNYFNFITNKQYQKSLKKMKENKIIKEIKKHNYNNMSNKLILIN